MEATMMDQLRYGGSGPLDFQGPDLSTSSWMDVLMSAQVDGGQEAGRMGGGATHHSPTDSSYNDGSLSSLDSGSTLGGGTQSSSSVFNDSWLDFGVGADEFYTMDNNNIINPACAERTSSSNRKPYVSSVEHLDGMRFMNGNVAASTDSLVSNNDMDDFYFGFRPESRIPGSSYGSSPYGAAVPTMASSNSNYMKPVGEFQVRQQSMYQQSPQHQQQQQPMQSNTWSAQSQNLRQVHHQAAPQQSQPLQFQQVQPIRSVDPESEVCGLRLVHLLLSCAESIQKNDLLSAERTLMSINQELSNNNPGMPNAAPQNQTGPMSRVAAHFAEAIAKRIYGVSSNSQEALLSSAGIQPSALSEILHFQFYETCPYLKFAHFTANQAILEAFKGAKHVHVIDFNLNHGLQWPALIQALAMRPGGPPVLRLTGIGPPEVGRGDDVLKDIGLSLAALAEKVEVQFEFRGVVANKLDDIKPWMLEVRPGEVVAVNSMMQLHKLLYADPTNSAGIDEVLLAVRSLNPKIMTVSEQEANHNSPNFMERFMEALHYYSSMFDSLEASVCPSGSSEQILAEMYLGREISNIVACEGSERVERHECLDEWRMRLTRAGFQQVHMGVNAFKQASMLLTLFRGQGYRVEDKQGCLTLCWDGRPLIAASAWHCP